MDPHQLPVGGLTKGVLAQQRLSMPNSPVIVPNCVRVRDKAFHHTEIPLP
jgi:hypothetical protein